MTRPRIGIFGALVAVGGVLAWHWSQRRRTSQGMLNRDLSRWEDEGGAVAATLQTAPTAPSGDTLRPRTPNGMDRLAAAGEPWPFPHGH